MEIMETIPATQITMANPITQGIKINPRKKVMDPHSIKAKEIPRSKDAKAAVEI